jgi:hypothetical protein
MQKAGLEWLHRLWQEPGRLFRRYVVQGLPFAAWLLTGSAFRGMLPKGRLASRYGRRNPCVLLLDDDPFALEHMELLLSTHFPEVTFEKRSVPDAEGRFDFYFVDHDFGGRRMAPSVVEGIRRAHPQALIFGFSSNLDGDTLRRLINSGCDGVCDKSEPGNWKPVLKLMEKRLAEMAERHRRETGFFGGVRHAAHSIHALLDDWNRRAKAAAEAEERAKP